MKTLITFFQLTQPQFEIILIACLCAVACSLSGIFLVLKQKSLMSDAISHSILFGIVIAFFVVHNLDSPFLMIGATLTGVLTVALTEIIIRTRKVKEDAAIGLVFPVLFSLGVILISKFASHVHIDTDAVLLGILEMAPFNRVILGGIDYGPFGIWKMGTIFGLNLIFILLFYKELKISTFDPQLSSSLGFSPQLLQYLLMTLVSITAVGAFDIVGSILVVALMIVPTASSYLLTNRLSVLTLYSILFGILSSLLGYYSAKFWNVNIAGSMASVSGLLFMISLFFAPEKGLLKKFLRHKKQETEFSSQMLLVHLLHHEGTQVEGVENIIQNLYDHFRWSKHLTKRMVNFARRKNWIEIQSIKLTLTPLGRQLAIDIMSGSKFKT